MQRDEEEQERRNEKHVDREKAAQSSAADGVPPKDESRQPIAAERNEPRLVGGHDYRPSGILAPAQQLARESHDQGEAEQQHAARPVHFPWKLVGAEQERLPHVSAH